MENNHKSINKNLLSSNKKETSFSYIKALNSKNEEKQKNQLIKRNYGIDLLRIFSMINIFNLHINLGCGIYSLNQKSQKFKVIWRLETFSLFGVNCFGLISGIVGYKKYQFSNLIYLWILVFFYSVLKSIILSFKNEIKKSDFFLSFFPILICRQWYFNAYFSMYLFLPFLNLGISYINRKIYKKLILFLIGFFSFYNLIGEIFNRNNYHFLKRGFSPLWLIVLYIIGGYFGKYIIEVEGSANVKYYFFYISIYIISSFFSCEIYFLLLKKKKTYNRLLINYLSPTILFQAMSLIMVFSKMKIYDKFLIKIISFFTPLTFSTLLIHVFLFKKKFYISFFKYVNSFNFNLLFFKIYGLSILSYFFCAFIDYFRLLLFKLIKIRKLSLYVEKKFKNI